MTVEQIVESVENTLFQNQRLVARLGRPVDLGDFMAEKIEKPKRERLRQEDSQIVGFRLPVATAKAIKVESARRQLPLNALLVEMWQLYREAKRAG